MARGRRAPELSLPTPAPAGHFDYSNLSGRRSGWALRMGARLVPGIRSVQQQIEPYARSWQQANQRALSGLGREGAGPLWVALGDSMTLGIGAPAYDRGWVGQLARRLDGQGNHHRVVNLAFSGAKVSDVVSRQLPALADLERRGEPVALVTVLIGSNDLIRGDSRRALPRAFAHLLQLLPAGTLVATLPNPRPETKAVNAAVARAAAARAIVAVETRDLTLGAWRGKLAADLFHPNEAGYAQIAAGFARALDR